VDSVGSAMAAVDFLPLVVRHSYSWKGIGCLCCLLSFGTAMRGGDVRAIAVALAEVRWCASWPRRCSQLMLMRGGHPARSVVPKYPSCRASNARL